ncbi:hypothetical protein GFS60_06851 (plasmid) [Rhodococcus sp. WAY2]|nr:hypothetical protein GFS60_06851 [Rhodococcus sp. WAY2]
MLTRIETWTDSVVGISVAIRRVRYEHRVALTCTDDEAATQFHETNLCHN